VVAAGLAAMLLLVGWIAVPSTDGPAEWSRFRGPNGSGVADTTGLPDVLGPATNVLWRTAVPPGHSSPVLSRERVFLTAFEDGRLFTLALDRDTGRELWRREAPRDRQERLDPRNNPAAPSPATDGERVYVFFSEFGLLAYDMGGTELWRAPLGPFDNLYGMGASPVVHDGVVYLVCDQRTGSFLVAIDAATGETVWRVDRPEAASSHATPILWRPEDAGVPGGASDAPAAPPTASPDGAAHVSSWRGEPRRPVAASEPQLIVVGSFLLSGYRLADGERLWWVRGMIHEMKSVPVLGQGLVFVNGYGSPLNDPGNTTVQGSFEEALARLDADGDGHLTREELPEDSLARRRAGMSDLDGDGKLSERDWNYFRDSMQMTNGIFGIRPGGRGDMTRESFLWRYSRSVPQLPSPLHYEGQLYMVNDGGIVTILDPATGDRLDQGRLEGAVDAYYASPVAADGKVFFVSELGKVVVARAGPELEPISVVAVAALTYATPAIEDGRIWLRTRGWLWCFGLQ